VLTANRCIVMKFGGTSVGDAKAIGRVATIVRQRLPERPIVVVSAMARVTDQLLQMARAAGTGDR
jgi:aspartate kinase